MKADRVFAEKYKNCPVFTDGRADKVRYDSEVTEERWRQNDFVEFTIYIAAKQLHSWN